MNLHKVKISGDIRPTLEIDGKQILATGVTLELDAHSLPVLRVALPVYGLDVDIEAAAKVDEPTRTALVALGWTEPGSPS